jgi:AcrR family transcriptional regulator
MATVPDADATPARTAALQQLPRGRGGLPPQAVAFLQRARALDATAQVVAETGFARSTVTEIAERAGISKRTFYALARNKEDAVRQAFDAAADHALPRLLEAFAQQRSWVAGVDATLTSYLRLLECDEAWASLTLRGLEDAGPELAAHRRLRLRPLMARLGAGPPGAQTGPAERRPQIVDAIVGSVETALRTRIAEPNPLPLLDSRRDLLYLALAPVVGPGRAQRRAATSPPATRAAIELQRAQRVAALAADLDAPGAVAALAPLVEEAVADRDGLALLQVVLAFERQRGERRAVPEAFARSALAGMGDASFFGLPLRAPGSGAVGDWSVVSSEQRCLRYIGAHPGCSGEDVRRALGFGHLSQASRLLTRLEREGLIARQRGRSGANAWRIPLQKEMDRPKT